MDNVIIIRGDIIDQSYHDATIVFLGDICRISND